MIAYTGTSVEVIGGPEVDPRKGLSLPARPGLLQKDAGSLDLLAAERAQEARDQAVHQLEIRGERRRALVRVVEHLFAEVLRVHDRAGAAVDEDELRLQDVALALHVGAHRDDAPAAERIVDLFLALDDARALV